MGSVQRLVDRLEEARRNAFAAVEGLDDAALNTSPPGLQNTPGILLRHLLGSERYWIHQVVGGEDVRRNREAEFDPKVPTSRSWLEGELEAVAAKTRQVLGSLPEAALNEVVEAQAGNRTLRLDKGSAVVRALEHWAYHHGQLRLMRRLLLGG
jgi:uncharacterized damage-inducible protein DinB